MSRSAGLTGIFLAVLFLLSCDGSHNKTQVETQVERKHYNSWEKDIGYAQVVKVDSTLYVSGITSGETELKDQLIDIYDKITRILEDYSADTSAIVKEVIYTKDIEALKAAIPVRKAYFKKGKYPSATWVQVDRLYMENQLLEVEIVAVVPESRPQ